MPADIQVNTAQNRIWEYCFLRETCRDSWQLSLPLRQIPAQMISRWRIKETFCVSTGKWAFTSLRNKCSRDKKIVGKKVSGTCRPSKAAGEFRLPPFWKHASPILRRLHSGAHCACVCHFPRAYATSLNIRYAYAYVAVWTRLKCHFDQIFTSWFFRCITLNSMKEWKSRLPFANTCISSGDIQVCKRGKICKWDDWWCHTLNPILHHIYKQSYLGQCAVQTNEIR